MADTYHPRGVLVEGYPVRQHPLYWTWADMKSRCNDQNQTGYENYGGRGIRYCDDWRHFVNFVRDMGPKPTPEHTLERKDVNADYCPENCEWATRSDQCLNRRKFKSNTTGFTGVVRRKGRFQARFDYNKQRYHIGYFDTAEEASAARANFLKDFDYAA